MSTRNPLLVLVALAITASSCGVELSSIEDKTETQIEAIYTVYKDVPYGSDEEQVMDIYLSNEAQSLGSKNFTIVFVHGGGYYVSDKSEEERYIDPYLKKGLNVVNLNYGLKQGIAPATDDLTSALNFLNSQSLVYGLALDRVVLTGFSSGAQIASNVGTSQNDAGNPFRLDSPITVSAIVNFSGPVDGLDVVEKIFIDHELELMSEIGHALFPAYAGYAPTDTIGKYETITYLDDEDPAFFIWHGGRDEQIPPSTFETVVEFLNKDPDKNVVVLNPDAEHSPNTQVLMSTYELIFNFLDRLGSYPVFADG